MAALASLGIGSGLDLNGIITKLMAVEGQPLTVLTQKEAAFQAKPEGGHLIISDLGFSSQ